MTNKRCIEVLKDMQMKLRQELTTYKDNRRYGYVEAEKKIQFIDELIAKLSDKVD